MRERKRIILISLFTIGLGMLLFLSSCTGIAPTSDSLLVTPIPAYVATDQALAFQARATREASESKLVELSAETTAVSLQMTAAAATEMTFLRQTEQSQQFAATSTQSAIEGMATTQSILHTATALSVASTATQGAYIQQATATQIAIGLIQASATAQIERLYEQRIAERQTLLFRTWAGRLSLVILFVGCLILTWKSVNWVLLRLFGIHRLANRPIVITPDGKGGFNVFDIARALQPGANVSQSGHVLSTGGAQDENLQNQVAARAQAGELMLAVNAGSNGLTLTQRRTLLSQALRTGTPLQPASAQSDILDAEVILLPSDDPRVRPLLDEIEPKLLQGGSSA